ncbi:hypothetical protein HJG60_009044 [Phyllostomus discolor]|uniref:Uncharacterized protein n=1 Tax=Phyllostomus discolor TaxID=89673 RepID=A0A834DFL4_9CHIR|nr:hypothetical protein HJG60_009044 [Phyllostomus discolor]
MFIERRDNRKETQRETIHKTPAEKVAEEATDLVLNFPTPKRAWSGVVSPSVQKAEANQPGLKCFSFVFTRRCTLKHLELYVAFLNKTFCGTKIRAAVNMDNLKGESWVKKSRFQKTVRKNTERPLASADKWPLLKFLSTQERTLAPLV